MPFRSRARARLTSTITRSPFQELNQDKGSGKKCGVFFPGERSANTRQERLTQGIPVDPTTWAQVEALFDPYGVRDQLADLLPSGEHP